MEINPLQRQVVASEIAPERLAGNPRLTREQKIAEASRQFEAMLLRQVFADMQKTVIPSEFSDNSTASGVYQDMISSTLADSISKSGALGLAQIFERQLSPPPDAKASSDSRPAAPARPVSRTAVSDLPKHYERFAPQSH